MMNAIVLLEANKFIVRTSHKVCNRIVKGLLVVTGWFRSNECTKNRALESFNISSYEESAAPPKQ
jgi:hypothetical protein